MTGMIGVRNCIDEIIFASLEIGVCSVFYLIFDTVRSPFSVVCCYAQILIQSFLQTDDLVFRKVRDKLQNQIRFNVDANSQ
jgi:long-subunit acyl-CoA synthetase (AMP-forming)